MRIANLARLKRLACTDAVVNAGLEILHTSPEIDIEDALVGIIAALVAQNESLRTSLEKMLVEGPAPVHMTLPPGMTEDRAVKTLTAAGCRFPRIFRVTRDVTQEECPWLTHQVLQGTMVYEFVGPTYGCVSPKGIAVSEAPNTKPFFELPRNAVGLAGE